ncbi:putative ATP-binding protein [Marinobacterium lacunae]|uniref:Putative ATP-binding protein n=1 Tax=Marinobacterium lacunae TaxID=1232683 RepID=A0A081FZE8_9GAMM|nr:hypothetical protein [Marinobacterium lacunae]KEA63903.1 putative ATP-binding protein [Marinobacterium lacunae]
MTIKVDVSKLKVPGNKHAASKKDVAKGTTVTPDDVMRDTPIRGSSSPSIALESPKVGGQVVREVKGGAGQSREPLPLIADQQGRACFVVNEGLHLRAVPVESNRGQSIVRGEILKRGGTPNRSTIREWTDEILAIASESADHCAVYSRVAPCDGGIEIYLGDVAHSRVRVTSSRVDVLEDQSDILFSPSPNELALPLPAETGSLHALRQLMNVNDMDFWLIIAWVTYTLAHAKVEGSKYVFLVLSGDQGTGKSFISRILQKLIDPSRLGIQVLPSRAQDLALVMQSSHVVAFDNMRGFKANTSDLLCIASTGGVINDRKLYTDQDIASKALHGAIIFNGVHKFVSQSDLAQRCLTIALTPIMRGNIRSESELLAIFDKHHPEIFRYLLGIISKIFVYLPDVKPIKPERMIDFCSWLAAFEIAEALTDGTLQAAYSENLSSAQLETLMDNSLASTIVTFCENQGGCMWTGTPTQFYQELCGIVSQRTQFSRDWPHNPIALGKRLIGLKASLSSQGINIEMSRGRQRNITIYIDARIYGDSKK